MASPTRGSRALDKAQRRLAQLKSIDENLDLGHGLTVQSYNHLIETARSALETYNTLRSELKAARETVIQTDAILAMMSERMLSGVATKYGKRSIEYMKAGGSPRSQRQRVSAAVVSTPAVASPALSLSEPSSIPVTNGFSSQ